MRKVISSILLIAILFNFVFCNNSYAAADSEGDKSSLEETYTDSADITPSATEDMIATGSPGNETISSSSSGGSAVGMVVGLLARLINILIALQVDLLMGFLSQNNVSDGTSEDTGSEFWFSIDRVVFNRVALFDINYFHTGSYTVGKVGDSEGITIGESEGNTAIKEGVAHIHYICRIMAVILSLVVLIYIGIRMAISTVASDKARYKKMLMGWVESIIILFVMVYVIAFIILIGQKLTDVFYYLRNQVLGDQEIFEDVVRSEAYFGQFNKSGFDLATWAILYWCLLILQVKFFFNYARRFLMVGLLITVSPLIIVTYSMDKAGDGKAQAFNNWIKEFVLCVLIQPLHALIYLIFAFTANEIASRAPLVALALMLSMTAVERMVRVVFNVKGSEIIKETHLFKKGDK